jgi:hypothetical protein
VVLLPKVAFTRWPSPSYHMVALAPPLTPLSRFSWS